MRGFSFIELMIALLILSVGISAMLTLQQQTTQRALAAQQAVQAWQLLADYHEQLRVASGALGIRGEVTVLRAPFYYQVRWWPTGSTGQFEVQVQWQNVPHGNRTISAKSQEINAKQ